MTSIEPPESVPATGPGSASASATPDGASSASNRDWLIYRGSGEPHDDIDRLPRRHAFDGGPVVKTRDWATTRRAAGAGFDLWLSSWRVGWRLSFRHGPGGTVG